MTEPQNYDFLMAAGLVSFRRDAQGNVVLEMAGKTQQIGSMMAAFPLTHSNGMVSLRDLEGAEIGILDSAGDLDEESRRIVADALERSYFMPRILDIFEVTDAMNVVEWIVETNRGARTFHVRHVRQNIRRIGRRQFVIKDVDGNGYEIRDWIDMPIPAQKLLAPYL